MDVSYDFKYPLTGNLDDYLNATTKPITVWQRVFLYLQRCEVDIYSPGQHQGECVEPYVVLVNGGTQGFNGSNQIGSQLIDVIVNYPLNNYSGMEPYMANLIDLLSSEDIKHYIRYTGEITPVVVDDTSKSYTATLTYQTFQRLRR